MTQRLKTFYSVLDRESSRIGSPFLCVFVIVHYCTLDFLRHCLCDTFSSIQSSDGWYTLGVNTRENKVSQKSLYLVPNCKFLIFKMLF